HLVQDLDLHFDILYRTVTARGLNGSDLVDHIKSFHHFTKDGVFIVELRSTTYGLISLDVLVRILDIALLSHVVQHGFILWSPLNNIKLRAGRLFLRIHLIALSCCGQGTFEMIVLDLRGDLIS